ncbi:hypothetical protein [Gemmatimonas sp.]|jgi:ferric-dicitrate binding protein FerR (iron transport regulator)|uniref:hypothetical protein n=1 Tax=Gemmatimonas sp. TaxID=1962908 RepID=UPI0037C02A92
MKRAHTKEHVEHVVETPRWLRYGGMALVAAVVIVAAQRVLDQAGSEVAVHRALTSEAVQHISSNRGQRSSFTLRDGTVTVTAAGTGFTMRHYPEEADVVVQVAEGMVSVRDRDSDATQTVKAGAAVRVTNGTVTSFGGVARDEALAWTRDSIVFVQAPLKTVVPELVRWFGMNAALVDSTVGDRPVSMRIALISAGDAATALTAAADLVITFSTNDRIEFRGAPATSSRTP